MSIKRGIAIVGGGIAGLAAAWRCHRISPQTPCRLFEAGSRVGGVLETIYENGFLVEQSADSFLVSPENKAADELAKQTGYGELIPPLPDRQRALLVSDGRLVPVPAGFYLAAAASPRAVLSSPLLSWKGKWALACERFRPRKSGLDDESLADFARRRVGSEVLEKLVQPLVSGIYSADPERLSMESALPQLTSMEREFGSLTKALSRRQASTRQSSGARYGLFRAPVRGMSHFVEHIAKALPENTIQLQTPIRDLAKTNEGWRLVSDCGEYDAQQVVLALPAHRTGTLLSSVDADVARQLRSIRTTSVAIVSFAFTRRQVAHRLDAFGVVVPDCERRDIMAISIASNKFPGRAPEGQVLFRVFLGGELRPRVLDNDDDRLVQIALTECRQLLEITGKPTAVFLRRWQGASPQYDVGHAERVRAIRDHLSKYPGIELAGCSYAGVGIPACVASGFTAVDRLQR